MLAVQYYDGDNLKMALAKVKKYAYSALEQGEEFGAVSYRFAYFS